MSTFRVTTITEVTVKFHPLTDKELVLQDFNESIFEVSDWDELAKFAAGQIARHGEHWIEGIGKATLDYGQDFSYEFDFNDAVHFDMRVIDEEIEKS